eukprot:TRINITY_DN50235_c0_g1_i1.p1 TRINITY_DN50235_c0_g1~~TRINITY_DN50235_c0_g1_i1.p1  ORF type:complete len:267 (-),score=36.42 TRINITY_DN50235_c0_g1_i1:119-919(-)
MPAVGNASTTTALPAPAPPRPAPPCVAAPGKASVHWRSNEATLNRDSLNTLLLGHEAKKLDITEVMMKSATIGRLAELGVGYEPPGMISRRIAEILTDPSKRPSAPTASTTLLNLAQQANSPAAQPQKEVTLSASSSAPTLRRQQHEVTRRQPVRKEVQTEWGSMLGPDWSSKQQQRQQVCQTEMQPRMEESTNRRLPLRSSKASCNLTSPLNMAGNWISAPSKSAVPIPSTQDGSPAGRGEKARSALVDPGLACHTFSREMNWFK